MIVLGLLYGCFVSIAVCAVLAATGVVSPQSALGLVLVSWLVTVCVGVIYIVSPGMVAEAKRSWKRR